MTAPRNNTAVIELSQLRIACKDCSLFQLCLPHGISEADLALLDDIIDRRRPLARGKYLFEVGGPFRSIYVVRSGSVKTFAPTPDGEEQVTGFHLPGELVGLDAISTGTHPCSAVALETASFCEIPFDQLEDLSEEARGLGRQLLRILSREIHDDHELLKLMGKHSAEARLAALLVSFMSRLERRGLSGRDFHLSMSRHDISNYLGLAVETVSRVFSRFQQDGLLTVDRRHVIINDVERLKAVAGP